MSEFDPSKPALVHDRLNDEMFEWMPERHMLHWEPVLEAELGVIAWDGLLLDGWQPFPNSSSPAPSYSAVTSHTA